MIKIITRLLCFLHPLFRHSGICFEQMLAIVTTKLTIDDRIEKGGKRKSNTSNTLRKQAILMLIIGGFFFLATYTTNTLAISPARLSQLSGYHSHYYIHG